MNMAALTRSASSFFNRSLERSYLNEVGEWIIIYILYIDR